MSILTLVMKDGTTYEVSRAARDLGRDVGDEPRPIAIYNRDDEAVVHNFLSQVWEIAKSA